MNRESLEGVRMARHESTVPMREREERRRLALEWGLESAWSVSDRTIPLFNRNGVAGKFSSASTFLGVPFQEDMRELDGQDVVFVGAPLDAGTTYRSGTRFGPSAIRAISSLSLGYSFELGVDLYESLRMVDAGDISIIPGNLEKSFDQIDKAVAFLHEREVFPVVFGGDHSIGYPDIRGLAPYVDGNIGIIHFDRHPDMGERTLDERMHGTPFFHATNIPNAPPQNLVQIGIGGWNTSRPGVKNVRERGATSITMGDIDRWGLERVAETALELAWKDATCVFLSFDIDVLDPAFAPGTGTPEPGGLLPREAFRLLELLVREGLAGMEVVEISPPYDVADITAAIGAHVVMDVLGILVNNGKLGRKPVADAAPASEEAFPEGDGG
jgi:agmatinase